MAELVQISHSRVEGFLLCERKDWYGYNLRIKRKTESASLALGTAVHACLEALYGYVLEGPTAEAQRARWTRAIVQMWRRYNELFAEGYSDTDKKRMPLKDILANYVEREALVLAGWRVLLVEGEFHVKWSDDSSILFKVDLIAADPHGRRVVIDHKAVWDFYTSDLARLQPQIPKYAGMLRSLGYKIDYGMYNMIRTRLIKEPKPEQLLAQLKLELSETRIVQTLSDQFSVAQRILDRVNLPDEQIDKLAVRTANNMVCKMCSYRTLCAAELNGDDTRLIMNDFTHRTPSDLPELDGEE